MPIREIPRSDGIVLDPAGPLLWTPRRPERIGLWSVATPIDLYIGQAVDLVNPRPFTGRSLPAACSAHSLRPRAEELAAYAISNNLAALIRRVTTPQLGSSLIIIEASENNPGAQAARAFSRGAKIVFIASPESSEAEPGEI